jgi:hypothetical protein
MRKELRGFLDTPLANVVTAPTEQQTSQIARDPGRTSARIDGLRGIEKAGKGRAVNL